MKRSIRRKLENHRVQQSEGAKIGRSEYLESEEEDGWRDFKRSMFWLAVIGGSLILLHGLIMLFIKIRWPHIRRDYGVLTFPRFEIFCIILALPCICKASTSLIAGGDPSGVAVGTLLLGLVFLILLCFFLFLLFGVTLGMLLLYDEDYYEEGQEQRKWYQPFIRVIGPDLRSEWFWKNQSDQQQSNQLYVTILGPLFEDLRGVRKYMLRQGNLQTFGDSEATGANPYQLGGRITPSNDEIKNVEEQSGKSHKNGDGIMASDDKTGDARALDDIIASADKTEDARGGDKILACDDEPEDARGGNPQNKYGDGMIRKDVSFREKLFSIPRTYYTLLETVRQVILAILGVAISDEESSKPSIITLCLTVFLLLFLVFLRPFVSKRGLVVESISVVCEVVLLTLTLLQLVVTDVKTKDIIGACMLILPFVGYVIGMLNQCYGLYSQIKDLDQQENLDQSDKSFIRGLKRASSGFLDFFLLHKLMEKENLEGSIPPGKAGNGKTGSSADRNRGSSTIDKPGIKQPTETTKSLSSSSKQASVAPNYP